MKFATKAVHAGFDYHQHNRAVMPPIYQTSAFAHDAVGEQLDFAYARTGTPTRAALEANLAALEDARHGLAFASGMAAIDAVLRATLQPGDEVIAVADLYGGAYRILDKVMQPLGIKVTFADLSDAANLSAAIGPQTRLVWLETPTNPLLNLVDVAALSAIAHAHGAKVAVDNTFATPYLQNPLQQGADIVVHSATKYLGGHSDVVMGALIVNDDELASRLVFLQNACGATPGPQDCFLVLRGIKTLHLRMERHCQNGRVIAEFLRNHPKVAKVYWPGFEDHPNHAVAKSQMRDFGGMISFTLVGNQLSDAKKVMENFHLFALAESLGGVESLCGHPASMTHASIPKEEREKVGLVDSLIRLSVGVEDVEDLKKDLADALAKV